MSYSIVAIANERGSPDKTYGRLQKAAASPEANYAG